MQSSYRRIRLFKAHSLKRYREEQYSSCKGSIKESLV